MVLFNQFSFRIQVRHRNDLKINISIHKIKVLKRLNTSKTVPFKVVGKLLPVPTELIAKQVYSPDIVSLADNIVNDGSSIVEPV